MRVKFCPKCGMETNDLYENLCKECFLEKITATRELEDNIIIKKCKFCNNFFYNQIGHKSIENAIENVLEKLFKDKNIISANYKIFNNKVNTTIKLRRKNLEKIEEKIFNLIIKSTVCKYCSLRLSRYFEAILQIRGMVDKGILDEINSYINVLYKRDKLAFISEINETRGGFDVFVGSKSAAIGIVNILKRKYKIKIKVSKKLYRRKREGKIYRDTILIKFGDI